MNNTVLIVDQTEFFLQVQRQFLRLSSLKVLTVASEDEAQLQISRHRPGLIFLDRGAPEFTGVEFCRRLKADPLTCRIPLVLLFASGDSEEEQLCRAAGCDAVLGKPLQRQTYLALGRRFFPAINRRELRVLCHATVFCRVGENCFYGQCVDLSRGGMFLESDYPLEDNEPLQLSLSLPGSQDDQLLELNGRVAWKNPVLHPLRSSYPAGFGIRFENLGSAEDVLTGYIERHSCHQEGLRARTWVSQQPEIGSSTPSPT